MTGQELRRRGRARAAKLAARGVAGGKGQAPIAPGLLGGRYLPLSDHDLGSSQTLELMEKEYVYPRLGDRSTPEEWQQRGGGDIRARALARVREILAEHYPVHIAPAVDPALRARFPIRLPAASMTSAGGRW